jgi:hypothetical protein
MTMQFSNIYIYFIGQIVPLAGSMNKRRNPPFTYFATAQHLS